MPTHPDRAGGIAFLGESTYAFGPVLFAQGAVLSGLIASRVLYDSEALWSFRAEAAGLVGFFLVFVLAPLTAFTPQLLRAKRKGLRDYGLLANRYVEAFEQKWVAGNAKEGDELLGSADIQSLADLGNSYAVVREMRSVPFGFRDVTGLAVITAAPLLPLGLIVFSPDQFVDQIVKVLLS